MTDDDQGDGTREAASAADEAMPQSVEGFAAIGFFTADNAVMESGKVYANGAYWT